MTFLPVPSWFKGTPEEYVADLRERNRREREAQGLPQGIQSPAVYAHLAELIKRRRAKEAQAA